MSSLDALFKKPIWRLTREEMDSLPEPEQHYVRDALSEMRKDGRLALYQSNPPDTVYERFWSGGGYNIRPVLQPSQASVALAVKAMQAVVAAEDACADADSKTDYSKDITAAAQLCRDALAALTPALPT